MEWFIQSTGKTAITFFELKIKNSELKMKDFFFEFNNEEYKLSLIFKSRSAKVLPLSEAR
jgi:hypothetical protein